MKKSGCVSFIPFWCPHFMPMLEKFHKRFMRCQDILRLTDQRNLLQWTQTGGAGIKNQQTQ